MSIGERGAKGWYRKVGKTSAVVRMAVFATVVVVASAAGSAETKRSFGAVPKQALVELKATIGKPFSSGLVFVDGRFIPPPYKVERFGTAFRINGQQVTRQVIPWDEFLKTQPGVRIEQVEVAPSATTESEPQGTAPEEDAEPADDISDISDDFDDLFDDNPKPKRKSPVRSAAKKPAPKASAPTVATKVVFDGTFKPNTRTKAMVARLNKIRTDMEVLLRKGGTCFFGTRYSTVTADRAPTDMFLQAVPQAMRENSDYEDFASAVRAKGIVFLPESVLRDLFSNRLDYIKLQERARAVKEERAWEKKLNNSIR